MITLSPAERNQIASVIAGHDTRYRTVHASVRAIAGSAHETAALCQTALVTRERLNANWPDSNTVSELGRMFQATTLAESFEQALAVAAGASTYIDNIAHRDIVRAALRAAGWEGWLDAIGAEHQIGRIDAKAALELVRCGVTLDDALAAAELLADPSDRHRP